MYYLGRAFATGGDPEAVREFDTIWDLPGVPGRFRLITAVWGVSFAGEAVVRTVLAVSVPTRTFLIATPIINWGVLGSLLWFTAAYRRRGEQQVRAVGGDGVEVTEGDVHEP
jgi:uncharacterized membrane protein